MNIIVTTPKGEIRNAAEEAKRALAGMVSHYFRRLTKYPSKLKAGDKVFYVENGFIRGFAIVEGITNSKGEQCDTTKKNWPDGVFVWMRCNTWRWIEPIPMEGFRNYRYVTTQDDQFEVSGIKVASLVNKNCHIEYKVIGDWKDPKPKMK